MDKPYLVGRATALVESLVSVPVGFAGMVQTNPLQKLSYHLREALKTEDEELIEVVACLGDIPSPFVDAKAQFYVGYYHQKSELSKTQERIRMGQRIAALRKEKGMTQRALAEATGILAPHIARIEKGNHSVGFDTLQTIAAALGGNIDIVQPMPSMKDKPTRTEAITVRYPKDVLDRAAKETDPDRRSRIFMEEAERQFLQRLAPSFFKMEFDPSARSLFDPDPQE